MNPSHHKYLLCTLLLASLFANREAPAQNQALDLARDRNTEMHPSLREGLNTIGRYADTVNRQIKTLSGNQENEAPPAAGGEAETPSRPAGNSPPARRQEFANDPFAVSPQLREGRTFGSRYAGIPGASVLELQRQVQLRALLSTPHGKAAMLSIKNSETITVMEKELVDLGPLGTFFIQIDRDAVTLFNPSAPQGKRIVLR